MVPAPPDVHWQRVVDELAIRLLTVRRARHVAQVDLADAAGLTRGHVQALEYGRSVDQAGPVNPTLRTVYGLARALGVPPRVLLPGLDASPARGPLPAIHDVEQAIVRSVLTAVDESVLPTTTRVSQRLPS